MVTLRDVARHAGVSVSTVSRILSNSTKAKYAEGTQLRVLRASVELGYRPNFAARALVSGKTCIIAAVFPRIYDTPFTALASLQILSGIEAFCSENGYHVLLSSPRLSNGIVDASFINLLASGYPDGIIIDSHFDITPIMAALEPFQLPTVVLGYHPHSHYLRSDNFLGGSLLMEHVIELGHRHIGIIGLPDRMSAAADQRLCGIQTICEAHGLDYEALPRIDGTFSAESGAAAAAALLESHPEITALVALNDRMAMGAIRQLQQMGYRVPDQISVVGYDDLPQAREFGPPLTTINQQLEDWGRLAMNMLLELFEGHEPEPVILPPRLMVRQSSAPVRSRTAERMPDQPIH
ncbi:MAG TPA: LacI family DNA-binding transcriptional regulator [Spirillospora sp.]|nr:LacI family DNA-binding transcriptional regulator [Spirillospora sp.]